jgi:hypothetical protein
MKAPFMINGLLKSRISGNHNAVNFTGKMRIFWFSLLFGFLAMNLHAQVLQEYEMMMASMNASSDPAIRQEAVHLDSLLSQGQPKIYFKNLVQTVTGDTDPVCLVTDNISVGMLSATNPLFSKVELITFRILDPGDLNFVLNLANLPSFEHLKYIQFLCLYQADPENLIPMYTPNDPSISVFYKISIPN